MNPRRLVASLLEDDIPLDSAGGGSVEPESFDLDAIKDYAKSDPAIRELHGVPVTGFHRDLLKRLQYKRLRAHDYGGKGTKVEPNTWILQMDDGSIAVRVYRTDIIRVTPEDTITVSTGGYHTRLTQGRLAEWLPGGWRIYTQNGDWYWWNYKEHGNETTVDTQGIKILQPFGDGDQITADGTLHPTLPPRYEKIRKRKLPNGF